MNIYIRKHKIIVQDQYGSCTFNYIINPYLLTCQCTTCNVVCKHLIYYLVKKWNFDIGYIAILNIPQIRSWLKEQEHNIIDINLYCRDFLHSTDCCICLLPYIKPGSKWVLSTDLFHVSMSHSIELYQCKRCREMFHTACYRRWNKECPKCKYNVISL